MTYGNGCRLNMALKNVARDRVSDPGAVISRLCAIGSNVWCSTD